MARLIFDLIGEQSKITAKGPGAAFTIFDTVTGIERNIADSSGRLSSTELTMTTSGSTTGGTISYSNSSLLLKSIASGGGLSFKGEKDDLILQLTNPENTKNAEIKFDENLEKLEIKSKIQSEIIGDSLLEKRDEENQTLDGKAITTSLIDASSNFINSELKAKQKTTSLEDGSGNANKAARDAYVAATATYTKSLYEKTPGGEEGDRINYGIESKSYQINLGTGHTSGDTVAMKVAGDPFVKVKSIPTIKVVSNTFFDSSTNDSIVSNTRAAALSYQIGTGHTTGDTFSIKQSYVGDGLVTTYNDPSSTAPLEEIAKMLEDLKQTKYVNSDTLLPINTIHISKSNEIRVGSGSTSGDTVAMKVYKEGTATAPIIVKQLNYNPSTDERAGSIQESEFSEIRVGSGSTTGDTVAMKVYKEGTATAPIIVKQLNYNPSTDERAGYIQESEFSEIRVGSGSTSGDTVIQRKDLSGGILTNKIFDSLTDDFIPYKLKTNCLIVDIYDEDGNLSGPSTKDDIRKAINCEQSGGWNKQVKGISDTVLDSDGNTSASLIRALEVYNFIGSGGTSGATIANLLKQEGDSLEESILNPQGNIRIGKIQSSSFLEQRLGTGHTSGDTVAMKVYKEREVIAPTIKQLNYNPSTDERAGSIQESEFYEIRIGSGSTTGDTFNIKQSYPAPGCLVTEYSDSQSNPISEVIEMLKRPGIIDSYIDSTSGEKIGYRLEVENNDLSLSKSGSDEEVVARHYNSTDPNNLSDTLFKDAYLKAANELKLATGPYKAARDAYATSLLSGSTSGATLEIKAGSNNESTMRMKLDDTYKGLLSETIMATQYSSIIAKESDMSKLSETIRTSNGDNDQEIVSRVAGAVNVFNLEDTVEYDAMLKAANELKLATGPYKAARDVYMSKLLTGTTSSGATLQMVAGNDNEIVSKLKVYNPSKGLSSTLNYSTTSPWVWGFDLEDYAGTERAVTSDSNNENIERKAVNFNPSNVELIENDAMLKAANELKLATGPYKAIRDVYMTNILSGNTVSGATLQMAASNVGVVSTFDVKDPGKIASLEYSTISDAILAKTHDFEKRTEFKQLAHSNRDSEILSKVAGANNINKLDDLEHLGMLKAANELKLATGPYKAARDTYAVYEFSGDTSSGATIHMFADETNESIIALDLHDPLLGRKAKMIYGTVSPTVVSKKYETTNGGLMEYRLIQDADRNNDTIVLKATPEETKINSIAKIVNENEDPDGVGYIQAPVVSFTSPPPSSPSDAKGNVGDMIGNDKFLYLKLPNGMWGRTRVDTNWS